MREIIRKRQFKKDYQRIQRTGRNLERLFEAIELLQDEQPLPPHYRDHQLSGNWKEHRECHLGDALPRRRNYVSGNFYRLKTVPRIRNAHGWGTRRLRLLHRLPCKQPCQVKTRQANVTDAKAFEQEIDHTVFPDGQR